MIEGLKSDDIIQQIGGRFRLTALIQRRLVELMQGARPMVDTRGLTDIEVVVKEILEGRIDVLPAAEQGTTDESEEDEFPGV
jgi:DNA-directed RNA polymerase subunit omega